MRILVVSQDFPWPADSGSFLRLSNVLSALGQLGEVELFSFVYDSRRTPCEPDGDVTLTRLTTTVYPVPDFSWRGRLRWTRSPLPLELSRMDFAANRADFLAWRRDRYDLVWFSKAGTYEALGRPRLGPTIVDLDDLEDHKLLARLASSGAYPATLAGRLHRRGAVVQGRVNARRWDRLQRAIAAQAEAVAVCSELDRLRLDVPSAVVVPNGYEAPSHPAGRSRVGDVPTVLLQGVLHYLPNSDAAQWLVRDIAPIVRKSLPHTRIRLVGDSHEVVDALHDPPRVEVTGRVPSMLPELARADVVVVPIRYGSGTRVKILEAFAHRLPVVSTTLGAEGLDLEHGRHALLADDAEAFAACVVRLLTDVSLRTRLVEAAHQLFLEQHQWTRARRIVTDAAAAAAGGQRTRLGS